MPTAASCGHAKARPYGFSELSEDGHAKARPYGMADDMMFSPDTNKKNPAWPSRG